MAALQFDPKSKRWRIRFYYAGQEYKRSLKTKDEERARSTLQRVEDTLQFLEQGRLEMPGDADPGQFILSEGMRAQKVKQRPMLTLHELFATYRDKFTAGAKEKNTRRIEDIHAEHLERLIGGNRLIGTIGIAELQQFVDLRAKESWLGKPIKSQTIKKAVETLQTVWNWARRLGLCSGSAPTTGLVYPRQLEKPPFQTWQQIENAIARGRITPAAQKPLWDCLFLSMAEVHEVLAFVQQASRRPWLYPMLVFAAHTGARKSEMLRALVADFHFDDRTVLIREKKRKKGRETTRRVEMTPMLAEVMQHYFATDHTGGSYALCQSAAEPLTDQTAHGAFRWVFRKSKWKVLRGFHVFRHSFASNLASAGIDQRIIDEFMGHQTEAMRRRYRHLFPEQRRRAIESVFADRGQGPQTLPLVAQ